jgi:hypothetical protein
MSDINFHKPYRGREDNRYTFKIQKLYKYQYLLQEITKELQEILKQKPEYKNKANINLEINKLTTHVSFDRNPVTESNILKSVIQKKNKAKIENIYLFNLVAARKILLERIPILESNIESLPVPQNSNDGYSNNEEPNYNKPLAKLKPKLKTNKKMTEKEKLKMIRKRAEKSPFKLLKNRNLGSSTFQSNSMQMQEEMNKEAQEAYEAELYNRYLREEHEEQERLWKLSHCDNSNNCSMSPPSYSPRWFTKLRPIRFNGNSRSTNSSNSENTSNSRSTNPSNSENTSNSRSTNSYLTSRSNSTNPSNSENTNNSYRTSRSKSTNSSNSENNSNLMNSSRSLKHPTKFFSNEESNSGYEYNKFLASRHKRTDKNKSKRRILKLKHLE